MRPFVQFTLFSYFIRCTVCWWMGGSEEPPETGYAGYTGPLGEGKQNVQKVSWTEEAKSKYHCGLFNWGRCVRYRTITHFYLKCLDGWTQKTQSSDHCELAICDSKTNLMGACSIFYSNDYQKTRAGIIRSSGGSCTAPETCSACTTGFYSDGPYCRICGKIANCNHRVCTSGSSQICEWCEGELTPARYYKAYTKNSAKTQCEKACSWRADSTRCYPGECGSELASNCVCAANFGGTHCENINDAPKILYNFGEFADTGGHNVLRNNPNSVLDSNPIMWTNFVAYTVIKTEIHAKYLQPPDDRGDTHYVRGFKVGVIEEKVTLSYYKGSTLNSVKATTCPGMDKSNPVDDKLCESSINSWTGFEHDDKVIAEFSSTNGGFVQVANRELNDKDGFINTYYYNGQTATREFEYHWDLVDPYHCSVSKGKSCSPFVSVGTDITDNPSITFTWDEWADDLAGLDHYEYDLFELGDGLELVDGRDKIQTNTNVSVAESSATLTMTKPGMYSIHMTAVDKAGNYMTGRGLFFFDDESVVDKQGDPTYCPTASQNTSNEWVVVDTDKVKVQFKDRFINTRHKQKRWLNRVQTYNPQKVIYEDLYGDRTNEPISHIHAIVDFQVSYEVHSDPDTVKDSRPLTPISPLQNQYDILTLNWADGDRLTSTVKAFDVLREFNEDTIVIYKDATPPVIENLWLTKGNRVNISVHYLEDFTKMTIEWEAYDIHSGLDSIYWKLYDHKTGDDHGYEDILAQGPAAVSFTFNTFCVITFS